jgi:hypothetical protein
VVQADTRSCSRKAQGFHRELLQEGRPDSIAPHGWTTWRDYRKALKGNSYSRNSSTPDKSFGFIPTNAKATNDYRRVASVAYLVNVFDTPADSAKLKALSERFNGDFATIGDCEAAHRAPREVQLQGPVSLKLLDLADRVREMLAANPKLAEEVRKLMDKDKKA